MIVKITSKRQVTFPARVLDALGVGPGDHLELEENPDGFILRPRRLDPSFIPPLRDKIDPNAEPIDMGRSGDCLMTHHYGIDASVLVRLSTGAPPDTFSHCEKVLRTCALHGYLGPEICTPQELMGGFEYV